jgi:glutathione reductase (NADPH)
LTILEKITVYDLIIIGIVMACTAVASNCSSKGLRVSIIDSMPFGGTCALRGCKLKKDSRGSCKNN